MTGIRLRRTKVTTSNKCNSGSFAMLNSEFKQIVGRTRLFDGKNFFAIYDFINASERFKDPESISYPLKVNLQHAILNSTDYYACKEVKRRP
jgi:hypothetical protein